MNLSGRQHWSQVLDVGEVTRRSPKGIWLVVRLKVERSRNRSWSRWFDSHWWLRFASRRSVVAVVGTSRVSGTKEVLSDGKKDVLWRLTASRMFEKLLNLTRRHHEQCILSTRRTRRVNESTAKFGQTLMTVGCREDKKLRTFFEWVTVAEDCQKWTAEERNAVDNCQSSKYPVLFQPSCTN